MGPILCVREGCLNFPERVLLNNAQLNLYKRDKVALVGSNGSGKSTLLKLLSGAITLDSGEIFVKPGTKIAYLRQDIEMPALQTALELVQLQADCALHEAEAYLRQMKIEPSQKTGAMSGGEKRRTLLASVLAQQADVYLMDEPTNHLDIEGIEWLESTINSSTKAFVLVSHDKRFLLETSQKTWWLFKGKLQKLDQGFGSFNEWQEALLAEEARQAEKLNKKLEGELLWLHQGVTARRKRNQGRLEKLQELRESVKAAIEPAQTTRIQAAKKVNKASFILESFDVCAAGVKDFNYRILKGERIGIVGANGSGKTTLLKVLIKKLEPKSGSVRHGASLQVAYFEQDARLPKQELTVSEFIQSSGGQHIQVHGKQMHIGAYIKQFGLDPKELNAKLSTLSGGQVNRLRLAKTLAKESNLLALDEPTNDLDMEASESLLDALSNYGGTILIVTHDRDFLDQFATRTIFVSQGGVRSVIGGYGKVADRSASKSVKKEREKRTLHFPYHLKRRLELLPEEISSLESEVAAMQRILERPEMYEKGRLQETQALSEKLSQTQVELESKLEEWFSLELMRDQVK